VATEPIHTLELSFLFRLKGIAALQAQRTYADASSMSQFLKVITKIILFLPLDPRHQDLQCISMFV
jgi:hypothetical protein